MTKGKSVIEEKKELVQLLSGVQLFKGLSETALEDVAAAAQTLDREEGASFFVQGDAATRLFVIADGRVKVSQVTAEGHQIVVRYAGGGEMFGCVPLYGGEEYPATASAIVPSRALYWSRSVMDRLMERHPRIAINALELLGEELALVRSRYQELATERVERRVARALLRLVGKAGRKVEKGVMIRFPLSRQDLAELTGTTLHTVSRILSSWEQRGLIESGRRRIVILNPHGLVSVAEDLEFDDGD
ncbi:MAG TPA: Crp/Fnr family transcriptional regulator [Acidobacteriota bacterium]|nr:Crp/Fnr family transcriptional regulator [Acidobacteriota bacterium]